MRTQTNLDNIATIIQIGHVSKHTSEQIAADVMAYITASHETFDGYHFSD